MLQGFSYFVAIRSGTPTNGRSHTTIKQILLLTKVFFRFSAFVNIGRLSMHFAASTLVVYHRFDFGRISLLQVLVVRRFYFRRLSFRLRSFNGVF